MNVFLAFNHQNITVIIALFLLLLLLFYLFAFYFFTFYFFAFHYVHQTA
jgi:hypothetical protein